MFALYSQSILDVFCSIVVLSSLFLVVRLQESTVLADELRCWFYKAPISKPFLEKCQGVEFCYRQVWPTSELVSYTFAISL